MGVCTLSKTSQNEPGNQINELTATIRSQIKDELDRQMTVSGVTFQTFTGKFQKTVSCDMGLAKQETVSKQQSMQLRLLARQSDQNSAFFQVKNLNQPNISDDDSQIESNANYGESDKEKPLSINIFSFETFSLKPIYREDDYILLNGVVEERQRQLILGTLNAKQPVRLQTVILAEGQTYSGEWLAAKRHGNGRHVSSRGTYDGEWAQNKMNGKGVFTFSNKDRYQGEFKQGMMHGMGKMQQHSGSIYEGEFKAGKKDGNGIQVYDHGQYYQGQWKEGYKHGQGHLQFSDGSYCRGHFMDNFIHGYAQYCWAGQKKYRGNWALNKSQGQGIMQWVDGRRYEGGYVNDKMQGRGIFTYPNGQVFSGIWRNNKKNGRGEYTDSAGKKIKGVWYGDRLIEQYVNISSTKRFAITSIALSEPKD